MIPDSYVILHNFGNKFVFIQFIPPFIFPQGGKVKPLLPLWGKAGKGVNDNENDKIIRVKHKLSKTDKIIPIEPPCKKTIYKSKEEAQEAIKYMKEIRVVELNCYHCSICGFWHLTSK
jgi:hypothetical protein